MNKYIDADGIMRACYDSFLKTGNKAYHEIPHWCEVIAWMPLPEPYKGGEEE